MKKFFLSILLVMVSICVYSQDYIRHIVEKGDTVYSLAKKYGVTLEEIYKLNPEAKNGINLGVIISIPKKNKKTEHSKTNFIIHKVLPKETFFGIAQKYGTTIQAIQQSNKDLLVNGLRPGQELVISINKKTESLTTIIKDDEIIHIVLPKETKFSISKRYGISQEELVLQNPHIVDLLREGDTLRISLKKHINQEIENTIPEAVHKKEFKNLVIKNSPTKNIAIILPFRASSIDNVRESFKKDRLLNITVDFYAGSLIAIDSIKKMGGNFNVVFYDSEGNNSDSIENLINKIDLSNTDAIIGPFYHSNVEKVASFLKSEDVLVFSPLSTEGKANYENLYLVTPTSEISKKTMLEYIRAKDQNTIAIIDKKKSNIKEFIATNYAEIQFVDDPINKESIQSLLDSEGMNYVILETESTSMVLSATNILNKLKENYAITLVTLERNDAFESDEIKSSVLASLNLHYPLSINEATNKNNNIFYTEYKRQNNVFPSVAATKGFDIIYDILLRLSQDENFSELSQKVDTKQTENKFSYVKSDDGGYYNTGVFILYYHDDLTIREAK